MCNLVNLYAAKDFWIDLRERILCKSFLPHMNSKEAETLACVISVSHLYGDVCTLANATTSG